MNLRKWQPLISRVSCGSPIVAFVIGMPKASEQRLVAFLLSSLDGFELRGGDKSHRTGLILEDVVFDGLAFAVPFGSL